MSDSITSSFAGLGVLPEFRQLLAKRQITEPTDIQEQVIPLLLSGRNLLFTSPTGTGKTLAYLLPLAGRLLEESRRSFDGEKDAEPRQRIKSQPCRFLVCAPTYELASQIKGEADLLLEGTGIGAGLLIGQTSLNRQIESLKKAPPGLVIGNPGRLLLLAKMGKLRLDKVAFIILDEGDRLVSDELLGETREFLALVRQKLSPEQNEKLLIASCSATCSKRSGERLLPFLGNEPLVLERPGDVLQKKVEHWALYCEERDKLSALRSFVTAASRGNRKNSFKALVFTGKSGDVGKIMAFLQGHGFGTGGLLGDMKNQARKQALDYFRSGKIKLLVTTDLAARGLDIREISHIIALDVGQEPDTYIHRAGRTARAGKRGIMVTIGNEDEMRRLAALEKRLGIIVYPKELYGGRIVSPEENLG